MFIYGRHLIFVGSLKLWQLHFSKKVFRDTMAILYAILFSCNCFPVQHISAEGLCAIQTPFLILIMQFFSYDFSQLSLCYLYTGLFSRLSCISRTFFFIFINKKYCNIYVYILQSAIWYVYTYQIAIYLTRVLRCMLYHVMLSKPQSIITRLYILKGLPKSCAGVTNVGRKWHQS